MKIYTAEKDIEKHVLASKTCGCVVSSLKITDAKIDMLSKSLDNLSISNKISKSIAQIVENEHPDLMYCSAILVSTVMNKNDDIFTPEETWNARATTINTPYNEDHIESDIIGHIIGYQVTDASGVEVPENSQTIPNYFDIVANFVMYKSIFPKIASAIAEKAPKNETFVSMECKFKGFDYGLYDAAGNLQVVARNEETAFLTKFLRAYGGNGLYKNYRIGRLLRDFRFVGMGNVEEPANPASEYVKVENFNSDSSFSKELILSHKIEGQKMEELTKANEQIESLKTELTTVKAQVSTLDTEKTELTSKLSAEILKAETAEKKIAEAATELETMKNELAEAKKQVKDTQDKMDKMSKCEKKGKRCAALAEFGIELTEEKQEQIADMSDDVFASLLEFTKTVSVKAKASVEPKVEDTTLVEENATATEDADKALEATEPVVDTELPTNAGSDTNKAEEMQNVAAKIVASLRKNKKNSSKSKNEQ